MSYDFGFRRCFYVPLESKEKEHLREFRTSTSGLKKRGQEGLLLNTAIAIFGKNYVLAFRTVPEMDYAARTRKRLRRENKFFCDSTFFSHDVCTVLHTVVLRGDFPVSFFAFFDNVVAVGSA